MRKLISLIVVLSAGLTASAAWAQDYNTYGVSDPAYGNSGTQSSTANRETVSSGLLRDEVIGIKPAAGVIAYVAPNGQTQARGALALLTDLNFARILPENLRWMYFGATTGALVSHLGSETSNFFGAQPGSITSNPGANIVLIPANLELGINPFGANTRLGVHGGGNVLYRSQAGSLAMGDSSTVDGAVWRIFPNVGVDLDAGLGRNVALYIRPDWTFTPGQDLFSAAVGIGINLG